MNISEHISSLLYKHDCVIIPDFGGFIANYKPAGYSSETHIFYPPTKNVVFNCNLTINDGLLANQVANYEGISYSQALTIIANFVYTVKSDLNNGNTIVFKGLGTFVKQSDSLIFSPDNTINRLIEAFGLPILQLPIEYENNVKPIFSKQISNKSNVIKKVAVVIPIILILALFPLKMSRMPISTNNTTGFYSQNFQKNNLLNNPSSFSDVIDKFTQTEYALYYSESNITNSNSKKVFEKDTLNYSATDTLQKKIIANKNNKANINDKTIIEPASNKKYFIIAGSFVEMKRVNVFCNELKSQNFNPEVVKRDGKLRISVASFERADEANKSITLFKQQHPKFPVWLLSI